MKKLQLRRSHIVLRIVGVLLALGLSIGVASNARADSLFGNQTNPRWGGAGS